MSYPVVRPVRFAIRQSISGPELPGADRRIASLRGTQRRSALNQVSTSTVEPDLAS